ncbi:MAG: hypothetical protein V5A46_00475 [Haloferacaceae archaeon]
MNRRSYLHSGVIVSVAALGGCVGNGDEDEPPDDSGDETEAATETEETEAADGDHDQETEEAEDDTDELTGVETYSGEWEGEIGLEEYNGVWQFEADFDNEQVEGEFYGDGRGDITGTVSGGKIEAEGAAAFGSVKWSGEFSSDGEEISGTWELAEDAPGSGEWSGSVGELPEDKLPEDDEEADEEEEALPKEDQVSGDEPLPRYPASVMLEHSEQTVPEEGTKTEITYGTSDSLDDVVAWYEDELEELGQKLKDESEPGETMLEYLIEEEEYAQVTVSEGDYTEISLVYVVPN